MSLTDNAKANRIATRKQRHAERTLINGRLVHPTANHGTSSAYVNYGCRCPACLESERKRWKARDRGFTRAESAAIDTYARSIPNRTPIPTADLQLAAYIREGVAA